MEEKQVGKVNHYFGKVSVGMIDLTDTLKVGDTIHVKGAHVDFTQKVESMQIDRKDSEVGEAGQEIGIKISEKVHENDIVYKVIEEA